MKTTIIGASFALIVLAVSSSCDKAYTCTCIATDSNQIFPADTSATTINSSNADKARTQCEESNFTECSITSTCSI